MEKSLTITLDETLIAHARQRAEHEGKSTDELIAQLISLDGHKVQNPPEWARAWSNSFWSCDIHTIEGSRGDSLHFYPGAIELKAFTWPSKFSRDLQARLYNPWSHFNDLVEIATKNQNLRVVSYQAKLTSEVGEADYSCWFQKGALKLEPIQMVWPPESNLPGTFSEEQNATYSIYTSSSDSSLWGDLFAAHEKSEFAKTETSNNNTDSQQTFSFYGGEGSELPASEKPKIDLVSLLRECDAKGISAARALKELGKEGRITKSFAEAELDSAKDDDDILGEYLAERYQ